jgi:hypothetical protein
MSYQKDMSLWSNLTRPMDYMKNPSWDQLDYPLDFFSECLPNIRKGGHAMLNQGKFRKLGRLLSPAIAIIMMIGLFPAVGFSATYTIYPN